jgi:ATP-dependent RNA helicase RhlE
MSFEGFDLDARVRAGVDRAGNTRPTPIHSKALPEALAGRDVLGLAQTGTGKTAAFVLPMLNRLIDGPRGRTRALVVAPTRELAEQIHGEIRTLGAKTGLRSTTVYGGVGKAPQQKALRTGVDIVVACPGRLLDHLRSGDGDLSHVEVLVLDEADHMFDMGFLPDVRRIVRQVPADAQHLLFSATMPKELRHLADEVLDDPLVVEIARTAPADTVEHALYPVGKDDKTRMLKHLLDRREVRSALVFTRTKHRAKRLAQQLDREGFQVASLQGNLSQTRRQKALDGFRDGKYDVLVATDIAARGIDVTRVSHVINYDVPDTVEAYTHRIGRTGRAERSGDACTMITVEDGKQVRAIERALNMRIERVKLEEFGAFDDAALRDVPGRGGRGGGRSGGGRGDGAGGRGGNGGPRSAQGGGRSGGGSAGNPGGNRDGGGKRRRRGGGSRRDAGGRPGAPGANARSND